jgi:mannose-6-phosphate isomerase-like protein (cupin superfamily)
MATVVVVDSEGLEARLNPDNGLLVRPTLGTQTDFAPLEQAVLELDPGRTQTISVGEAEETLFALAGQGTVHVGGESHPLEPEVAVYLPPGSSFELENPGPERLRLVAVRVPDPDLDPDLAPAALGHTPAPGEQRKQAPAISRLSDSELEQATTQREFRIVADPSTGLRSATHFVGYIPTERAPDHFHKYDEVIYVLDGNGVMHAGDISEPLGRGACIQLPARTVHCLENTGDTPMRVVAVFRPAGSPAAAFYPDGTPAYQGDN